MPGAVTLFEAWMRGSPQLFSGNLQRRGLPFCHGIEAVSSDLRGGPV